MFNLFIFSIVFLFVIVTVVIWNKVEKNHLNNLANSIIWFLPFEYLPSITISGARLKINYVIVMLATYLFFILIIKKKISFKFNNLTYLLFIFIVSTVISFENIINTSRFAVSYFGLILCLVAAIIVSNFATDIKLQLKRLFYVLCFCSIFGLYQFFGDLAGISPKYTFLKEMYTKSVFGIPRIQGTSNEPQIFAGILFFPLSVLVTKYLLVKDDNVLNLKFNNFKLILILFITVFILTISKGAFIAFVCACFVLFLFIHVKFDNFINHLNLKNFCFITIFLTSLVTLIPQLSKKVEPIIKNIIDTIGGVSPTSTERTTFFNQAYELLHINQYRGIGAGQFGSKIDPLRPEFANLIVNNAYLELWLEYGFISFLIFTIILLLTIAKLQHYTFNKFNSLGFILLLTLVSFLIQWSFFSPLYITPIFIFIGVCWNKDLEINYI